MRRLAALLLVVSSAGSAWAQGHPIGARLSAAGLDFLEGQVGKFMPKAFYPADITKQVFSCPGDDASVSQVGSAVALHLDSLDLSLPAPGRIRVDAVVSGQFSGELRMKKVVACAGSINCFDRVEVKGVRIIAELGASVTGGMPSAQLINLEVQASASDLDVEIYECGIAGSLATTVIGKVKDAVFDQILAFGNDLAMQKLPPMLDQTLGGVGVLRFSGRLPQASVSAELESMTISTGGIEMLAKLDATARGDMSECLDGVDDPGEPSPPSAPMPLLARSSHVGVGLSASLINETIYQVWRAGYMCITDDLLALVGVELHTDEIANLLPGIPVGTRMSFGVRFEKPPTLTFYEGDTSPAGSNITGIDLSGLTAHIDLAFPGDTQRHSIEARIDATATGQVRIVPGANVLGIRLLSGHITRLEVVDETGADALGMDFGRIRVLAENTILPAVGEMLGEIPITGSVFGDFEGMYVILRELRTTNEHLIAGLDLFAAPENDHTAPDTAILEYPLRPVRPQDAILRVSGSDDAVPTELLQYEITAAGVRQDPTFLSELKVGRLGESGVYQVEVRAMDLAGNVDGSPARAEVTVDGIPPSLIMKSAPTGSGHGKSTVFSWAMDDDMTAAGSLTPRIEVYRLNSGSDAPLDEYILAPGSTETTVTLADEGTYRVIVAVADAVGNEALDARIFTVGDGENIGFGCAIGGPRRGGRGTAGLVLVLGLGALVLVGRRRA